MLYPLYLNLQWFSIVTWNSEHASYACSHTISHCFWTVAPISVVLQMFSIPTTHFHTFATPIDCLWAQEYVSEHPDLFLSILNLFLNLLLIPYLPLPFSDLYHLFFDLHYSFSWILPIFNPYHLPLSYITYFHTYHQFLPIFYLFLTSLTQFSTYSHILEPLFTFFKPFHSFFDFVYPFLSPLHTSSWYWSFLTVLGLYHTLDVFPNTVNCLWMLLHVLTCFPSSSSTVFSPHNMFLSPVTHSWAP